MTTITYQDIDYVVYPLPAELVSFFDGEDGWMSVLDDDAEALFYETLPQYPNLILAGWDSGRNRHNELVLLARRDNQNLFTIQTKLRGVVTEVVFPDDCDITEAVQRLRKLKLLVD